MNHNIKYVDVCCGLNWGDEAKGKIITHLTKFYKYNFVCRWAGGNNAGHTVYLNGRVYKTHIVPCGIFYGIPSIVGPDCVVHLESFQKELEYLEHHGFNTRLVKISPRAHVITTDHVNEDIADYRHQGTTSKGIAPCYRDKYARKGIRVHEIPELAPYLWDEKLHGTVLCEGAQGFWLDINRGNYPYVTSSTTLPYGACSLGFPPQKIRHIYGATKIYDTRSGIDPDFPESLLEKPHFQRIIEVGKEYGTTTGRKRKVNWLNLDKLVEAICISGTTHVIMSKVDVLETVQLFRVILQQKEVQFENLREMLEFVENILKKHCPNMTQLIFSDNVETIYGL